MKEAGQFFPDYAVERPHAPVLEKTQKRLESSRGLLGQSFVHREDGKLIGHAAGLRIYSRTWMLQHLAVAPTNLRSDYVSQELISLVVEFGETLQDIDFIRYVWRTENRWPNRLSTWAAKMMATEGLTRLRHVNYMQLSGSLRPFASGTWPIVRPASPADLRWYESYLRQQGDVLGLRSDDLTAKELELSTLGELSAAHGVVRRRRIFVVDGPNSPIGLALAEESTDGLCWPELTNSFHVITPDPTHPWARVTREALVSYCVKHYREQNRASAVTLCDDSMVESLRAAGFVSHGRTAEWTFHKSLVRRWNELATGVFERFARRRTLRDAPVERAA